MGFDWSKVGNISVDTAKAAGKAGLNFGKNVGKGLLDYGSSLINAKTLFAAGSAGAIGYALADSDGRVDAEKVGLKAGLTTGVMSGLPVVGSAATLAGAAGLSVASTFGGVAMGLGKASLKMPKEAVSFENMGDIKFNKLGIGLVVGAGIIDGVSKAANKYEQIKMGTNDGMLRTSTPVIPQRATPAYANNGGATGDLVFSMYNNR